MEQDVPACLGQGGEGRSLPAHRAAPSRLPHPAQHRQFEERYRVLPKSLEVGSDSGGTTWYGLGDASYWILASGEVCNQDFIVIGQGMALLPGRKGLETLLSW